MTAPVGFQFRYMPDPRWGTRLPKDVRLAGQLVKGVRKLRYELARIKRPTWCSGRVQNDPAPQRRLADGDNQPRAQRPCASGSGQRPNLCFQYDGWRDVMNDVHDRGATLRTAPRWADTAAPERRAVPRRWSQLRPAPTKGPIVADEFRAANGARLFLAETAGVPLHDVIDADLYRLQQNASGPSDQGGTNELMAKVNRARGTSKPPG